MSDGHIGSIDLSEGTIISSPTNEYILIKELGEGGFGSVYRANSSQHEVALKIVKMWKMMPQDREEFGTRLQQEFDISRSIDSPYVVKGYEFSQVKGNPFIVMELCSGGSLRDQFQQVSVNKGNTFARGILNGLRDLHMEGVIHRDIKPENILLDKYQSVKLVDFGISGSIKKRHTQPNMMGYVREVFATITYSPPEQTDAAKAFSTLGPTNDIYAFGVTMYEYFTEGQLPFGSFDAFQDDINILDKRKRGNDWDRKTLEIKLEDPVWHEIIEKCLQPKPADRFSSCEEVLQKLGVDDKRSHRDAFRSFPPSAKWVLRVMQGDEPGREYNVSMFSEIMNKPLLTVGWYNSEDPIGNDVGLVENYTNYISSKHATLSHDPERNLWKISDGQIIDAYSQELKLSKNGVFVNGENVSGESFPLLPDDIITLGDTTLKVMINQA